jgi:hypothetical protein
MPVVPRSPSSRAGCRDCGAIARAREDLVEQGLSALHLFQLDRHYILADDKVQIVDEYTGRVMADRSWERGLHQMIEVKEGLELSQAARHDLAHHLSALLPPLPVPRRDERHGDRSGA